MFVFFFVVSVTFVIVNMFVSILNETFGAVRADINKQSNDYEIVDFMLKNLRNWVGKKPFQFLKGQQDKYSKGEQALTHMVDGISVVFVASPKSIICYALSYACC